MKSSILGALYLSLAASIWGGMYVVSKYVLDYIPPLTLVWLRYLIGLLVLFIILYVSIKKNRQSLTLHKNDWLMFIWIGFIGYFLSICLQFIGTKLSDAHTGALVTSATPAFIVIFARIVLKEALTVRKMISLGIATIGVIVVIGWDMKVGDYFLGSLALVGAAITWALLSVYVKKASKFHSSLTITTFSIMFAFIFTTPFMIYEVMNKDLIIDKSYIILGILYLGIVSTAGAFFLWNKGMELIDASKGSLFFFLQPIVGAFFGWLLLNEELHFNFYVGGLLIVAGVVIVTLKPTKKSSIKEQERSA
jgi:drug/metabolite transporter (DMT)-like permease